KLQHLIGDVNHQGVVLKASGYPYADIADLTGEPEKGRDAPFLLVLDHVQDPQNLGSLLRSADAAGVSGVVIPSDRAVNVTPAAVRASAGAAEHVRVAMVNNISQAMLKLKDAGYWFAGLEALPEAKPYSETDLTGSIGIVVGSEGAGLGRLVRETCDYLIKIPMSGEVSSLNAGVAGALALFEVRRQRLYGKPGKQSPARKESQK
ncbi:MAG: 23S rRNA (guanosine(2251)-2'-O)-methyltransferase RlmB, partial [Verrucomicrobia bacterium]|nr:23S rRNA (guanosine(2251)-2'-O)-methyltransferase RlmB [Verrucomicrobiota bacterium]